MFATPDKRLQFARALKSRPYTMIWIGQTISNLGDGIFNIALAWQVLLMTHSGTAMGIVLVASTIPRLVFVLIGGVAADRLPRRLIILWSDGGRGLIVLLISILGFMSLLQFWHLIIEALIFGVVEGFFYPAIMAITPDLVEKDDLASANALNSFSATLAQLLGPMLGAVLIALINPLGAFSVNALSFFISMAFLLPVRIPERHAIKSLETQGSGVEEAQEEKLAKRQGFWGVIADVQEGLV
jgi:MFS family permease